MAYQLPSVFYVKDDVESNVIFYHAKRKTEFEEKLNSLYCICPFFIFYFNFIFNGYLIKKITKVQMSLKLALPLIKVDTLDICYSSINN